MANHINYSSGEMMQTIELTGLRGDNPMSFLAALGIMNSIPNARLWWKDRDQTYAVLESEYSASELIDYLDSDKEKILSSPLFDKSDVRINQELASVFLSDSVPQERGLRVSLITDVTVDKVKGLTKPTDLYFTTGKQKFLSIVADIANAVTKDHFEEGIFGPWRYSARNLKTLSLDPRDDRNHALMASEPSTTPKRTLPALDWLAFVGFGVLPVFGTPSRVLTPGGSGTAGKSAWSWLLWDSALGVESTRTLMQQIPRKRELESSKWVVPKGIFAVYQSHIFRIGQGYGRFSSPKLVFRR